MATIPETIDADLKAAMKAKDAAKLDTLRMLKSALKMKAIEKMQPLEDAEAVAILRTYVKQQEEAKENFGKGGRADLAEKAEAEITFVKSYLPVQMSEEQLKPIVEAKIKELNATKADFGKVIAAVKKDTEGKADGGTVSKVVKSLLG